MKIVLLPIFIIMLSMNAFSQESSIYIGYKSMREINTSYNYYLGYNVKIAGSIGYIFATDYERPYGNFLPDGDITGTFTRKRNQQGISISTALKFVNGKRGDLLLALSFEYQYLKSGNYTYLTKGTSGYSPNINSKEYSEFKHTYNNYAFLFGIHNLFLEKNNAEIYFECGMALKYIERIYSIDGYNNYRLPSHEIEFFTNITPTFRIGINFRILNFGKKNQIKIIKKGLKKTNN